jgi:hypothetical protein
MQKFTLEISNTVTKNGENVREKIGEVEAFYPMLSEMGFAVEPTSMGDDGFPVYADAKAQFVFDALFSATKVIVKNRLQPKTANVKDGQTIPKSVEELITPADGNRGEALAIQREFLASFKAWLPSTGKSEKAQAMALSFARNREALSLQSDSNKQKFAAYLTDYVTAQDAELVAKFARPLQALQDAIDSAAADF